MNASSSEDRQLWKQLKQGKELALTAIYRKYVVDLYNYGHRFGADPPLLEDSIQDLFFTLWKRRASLTIPSSVKYYLFSALKNRLLNSIQYKQQSEKRDEAFADLHFELCLSPEEEAIRYETATERTTVLRQAIDDQLTPRQREAITLFFYDGLTYDEVASLLALPTKSTYKLIYRALHVLQNSINRDTVTIWVGWLLLSLYK